MGQINNPTAGGIRAAAWADRDVGATDRELLFVTDVGPTGALFAWDSASSLWKATGLVTLAFDAAYTTGVASLSEQIIKQAFLPGGLLQAFSSVAIGFVLGTVNTATVANVGRLRIGNTGTTADTIIYFQNLGSASNAIGTHIMFPSATGIEKISAPVPLTSTNNYNPFTGLVSVSNATVMPGTVTAINSIANDTYISISLQPNAIADIPAMRVLQILGLP